MKKSCNIIHSLPFLILAVFFYSCEKNTVEIENHAEQQGPYQSLADFYDQKGTEAVIFTVNPQQLIHIETNSGMEIDIPANSLFAPNGQQPSGPVTVSMKEIYTIKDMVLSHVPSTSNGDLLESALMLYLDFYSGSVHYSAFFSSIILPSANPLSGMKIYHGTADPDVGINWNVADTNTNFVIADSTGINPSYLLTVDSLGGWINCARSPLVFSGPPITIISEVDGWRGETVDIAYYLLLPSINSCENTANAPGPQTIILNNLPIGMDKWVAAIGIGRISRKSYFGIVNFNITAGPPINITLTQADEEITAALQAL